MQGIYSYMSNINIVSQIHNVVVTIHGAYNAICNVKYSALLH